MAAPRNSFEYLPLDTEACRSLPTRTRFVLAELLERTAPDAAELIRNTPLDDPVAPVTGDFLPGDVLEDAALATATAQWQAFQKANRALYGFLVLCVAQGKDQAIQGLLDSCGVQLTRDGLALWRALLGAFGGPSVSRRLALYDELFALQLPPATSHKESPQQIFGQVELIAQQLSAGGTECCDFTAERATGE